MNKGRCFWLAALTVGFLGSGFDSKGVIVFGTADPQHNTTPPTGALAGSGWDLQGDSLAGIPIAPNFFITARHVQAKPGDTFGFRGAPYQLVAGYPHPDADITIWRVNGTFPAYAQLYTSSDEDGKPFVVFGRGATRGAEIRLNGRLKGWAWGNTDGILRWGQNVVASITDHEGRPTGDQAKVQLLRADFDANGGPNEAQLSGGDSGGGVFIQQGGVWKLAGVNSRANKDYSYSENGDSFNATLFDESGFYEGERGDREYRIPDELGPQPGSFYATRISTYVPWIQSIVNGTQQPGSSVTVLESPTLFGPFTPAAAIGIDTLLKTITLPRPPGTRFYRVASDRPHVIRSTTTSGNVLTLIYE